jgi:Ribonuclease G/E
MLRGRPERLLVEREGEPAAQRLGAQVCARVRRVDRGLGMAFLDLGEGPDAAAPLSRDASLTEGAAVTVEIVAQARGAGVAGKGPVVRVLGPGDGEAPRLLTPGPTLEERLQAFAPRVRIVRGPDAREAADEAQAEVMEVVHALPDGGTLSIEPTRALIAVDVDLGARHGADSKRVSRAANLLALSETARLLRLKGLAGLVVIDLAGRGHDGDALGRAAREAFHADQPGVSIGAISRFGTMELAKPWRERPLTDRLCDSSGRLSALTVALQAVRALEREGRVAGGARLTLRASAEVTSAIEPFRPSLADRLGPRFTFEPAPGFARERFEVAAG